MNTLRSVCFPPPIGDLLRSLSTVGFFAYIAAEGVQ